MYHRRPCKCNKNHNQTNRQLLQSLTQQRRLNETFSGGMGSFVLATIIISFLQMRQRLAAYRGVEPCWNLGKQPIQYTISIHFIDVLY